MSSTTPSSPSSDTSFFGHPKGLSTLFFTEIWERMSYYGMRALLYIFMTAAVTAGGLGFDESKTGAIYGLYTAGVYLLALPGGWVADRILGKRRAIFWGGVILASGHFCLAIHSIHTFFFGLLLIVLGTGLLKPNVSAIVGDLYPEGGVRRDSGFSLFYMGVNLGAFSGPIICGQLGERVDWHLGFAAAGIGMVLGLFQYSFGQKNLGSAGDLPPLSALSPAEAAARRNAIRVLIASLAAGFGLFTAFYLGFVPMTVQQVARWGTAVILGIASAFLLYVMFLANLDRVERMKVLAFGVLFLFSAIFWSGFEQAGSSMTAFARDVTDRTLSPITQWLFLGGGAALLALLIATLQRHRSRHPERSPSWLPVSQGLFGAGVVVLLWLAFFRVDGEWEMPTSFFQSINASFIVIFSPVFAFLWPWLGRRNPSTPAKFGIGVVLLALGFLVLVIAAQQGESGKVLPGWLVLTYLMHTFGELFVSPVGLSTATKLAPRRYVSQMMGLWFISISLGNLVGGQVAGQLGEFSMGTIFAWVAGITAGSGVVVLLLSPWVKRWMADAEHA
jgi:POT family proton-dependent oligopeptide transporter